MKTDTNASSYVLWRQEQEWLGEWLVGCEQGKVQLPDRRALRKALGLGARGGARELRDALLRLSREPYPSHGDPSASLERLTRVHALLEAGVEAPASADGVFLCASCGEATPVDVDPEDGESQVFTVDCSVCCRPNVVRLSIDPDGTPRSIEATLEQA